MTYRFPADQTGKCTNPMGRRGFSLVEVMFSILILGLGLVSIAGLFPIAGSIQKETFDDMVAVQFGDSVRDQLRRRPFRKDDVGNVANDPAGTALDLTFDVRRVLPEILGAPAGPLPPVTILVRWTTNDRLYPMGSGVNASFLWVPLVQKEDVLGDFQLFAFMLRIDRDIAYSGADITYANSSDNVNGQQLPKVKPATVTRVDDSTLNVQVSPNPFQPGDLVLDNRGNVRTVTDVDGSLIRVTGTVPATSVINTLWYGERGAGGRSSAKQIIAVPRGIL